MEQAVYDYIERIILFGILVSVISQLLPRGKYEKYLKLYTGFLFLFLVLLPIVQWLKVDQSWLTFYKQYKTDLVFDGVEQEAKEKLFKKYEETLSEQLTTVLQEHGYSSDVTVLTDRKGEGTIQKVQVFLHNKKEEGEILIQAIEIGESESKKTKEESREEKEVKEIIKNICQEKEGDIEVEVKRQ